MAPYLYHRYATLWKLRSRRSIYYCACSNLKSAGVYWNHPFLWWESAWPWGTFCLSEANNSLLLNLLRVWELCHLGDMPCICWLILDLGFITILYLPHLLTWINQLMLQRNINIIEIIGFTSDHQWWLQQWIWMLRFWNERFCFPVICGIICGYSIELAITIRHQVRMDNKWIISITWLSYYGLSLSNWTWSCWW